MKNIIYAIFFTLILLPQMSFAQSEPQPGTKAWYDAQTAARALYISQHQTEIAASDEKAKAYYVHQARARAMYISQHQTDIAASDQNVKAYYDKQAEARGLWIQQHQGI